MLNNFLNVRKLMPFSRSKDPKSKQAPSRSKKNSLALRIVHAGGLVEYYYMSTPASKIMEKYPSFILTRPEVFRRPWDSVVRPDEILNPGETFFVVPRGTMRKLRKRIRKPGKGVSSINFFASKSMNDNLVQANGSCEVNKCSIRNTKKKSVCTKHSCFKEESKKGNGTNETSSYKYHLEKKRVQKHVSWQPSPTSISES